MSTTKVLRQKLFQLKQEQGVESEPLSPILKSEPTNTYSAESEEQPPSPGTSVDTVDPEEARAPGEAEGEAAGKAELMEEDLILQSLNNYNASLYSPRLPTGLTQMHRC